MGESFGTFLMPIYAIGSWLGLITQGNTGKYILPVALIGWIWALINVLRTKRLDLGIVSFFFVLVAALAETKWGFSKGIKFALSLSSILVAGNYSLVLIFWKDIKKDLVASGAKSELWIKIFYGYCAVMMIFWVCASAKTCFRNGSNAENGYTAVRSGIVPPR